MKKLLRTVFGTLLLATPALAQDSAAKAASSMATAQVSVGSTAATKLVLPRPGRQLLQVQCSYPSAFIGASSSVTTLTGFVLPSTGNNNPATPLPYGMTFNNYTGAMYAIVPAGYTGTFSCSVLEIY